MNLSVYFVKPFQNTRDILYQDKKELNGENSPKMFNKLCLNMKDRIV